MSKVFELHVWNGKRYEYELTEYTPEAIKDQHTEYLNDNYSVKIITKRINNGTQRKPEEILSQSKS